MVGSSEKTKLMIVRTAASKLKSNNLSVSICGETKQETKSDKLLGITMNNMLNWRNHLNADKENLGLVKELSHHSPNVHA